MSSVRGGSKWLVIVGIGVVVLFAAGIFWLRTINTVPKIVIPNPTVPSPNAYDYYVAAGNLIQHSTEIQTFLRDPRTTSRRRDYSLTEIRGFVSDDAAALAKLREGLKHEYMHPPARSLEREFPEYSKFRQLACLLCWEGRVKAGREDWAGAVNSYLDAMKMGETIPLDGVLITKMVGVSCQNRGRAELWKTLNYLNAEQAQHAAERMEQIASLHVPFADTLEEEKWFVLASMVKMIEGQGDWRPNQDNGNVSLSRLPGYVKRKIVLDYTRYMDQAIANARLPYASKPPAPREPGPPNILSGLTRTAIADVVNVTLMPVYEPGLFADVKAETQNALLTVSLALRAYRLEHGKYPKTLTELTPSYLKEIPHDLFALEGPLNYKPEGEKYILFSVGPDGKDDGGQAVDNPATNSSDERYRVKNDSTGDVVAGVNLD